MNRISTLGAVAALIVLFFAVNMLAGAGLAGSRIDLTEGRLYTLTKGSRNIARSLDEPVTLTLYYSAKQAAGKPAIQAYGQRIRELLDEYARASGGKITVRHVDPEPFSEAEDAAMQAGVAALPAGPGGESLYLGLIGTNTTDGKETIPFFDPNKERFVEYDVTRLIYSLANPKKKTVGLITSLPMDGGPANNPFQQQQQPKRWQILREVETLFTVRKLDNTVAEIPADIDVLWVVHPKNLPETTLYAIDQYVLNGGRLVAFVDPLCENDVIPGIDQFQQMQIPKNSDLNKLINAWGVETVEGKIAADEAFALKVNAGGQRGETVSYIAWLGIDSKGVTKEDAITGQLSRLNIPTAGIIRKKEAPKPEAPKEGEAAPAPTPATASVEIQPLIHTSARAQELDASKLTFMPDPKQLLSTYVPGDKELTIAARLTGTVKTAFPNGKPAPKDDKTPAPPADKPQLMESKAPINAILVADCDMLADMFWVREETLGPIVLGYRKLSDNGDFVTNAIDNMVGSADLISVRARGQFARPFDRVEAMEREAEKNSQQKVSELQQKLQQAETRIAELQRQRPGEEAGQGLLLTPEQQKEIEKFRDERLATRKELRQEQLNLRKDVEKLGTRLKFLNIGLMPALVALGAVGLGAYRMSRRGSDRKNVSAKE